MFTDLSPKHQAFVHAFKANGNATQAYIDAGYSPGAAAQSGYKLLQKPKIQDAIANCEVVIEHVEDTAEELEDYVEADADEFIEVILSSADDKWIEEHEEPQTQIMMVAQDHLKCLDWPYPEDTVDASGLWILKSGNWVNLVTGKIGVLG